MRIMKGGIAVKYLYISRRAIIMTNCSWVLMGTVVIPVLACTRCPCCKFHPLSSLHLIKVIVNKIKKCKKSQEDKQTKKIIQNKNLGCQMDIRETKAVAQLGGNRVSPPPSGLDPDTIYYNF